MENKKEPIIDAVKWLRGFDNKYARSLRYSPWVSSWDIDEARYRGQDVVLRTEMYGEPIVVTTKDDYAESSVVVMDIGDYMTFQFFTEDEMRKILPVYKVFRGRLVGIKNKEYEALNNYCREMDARVVTAFWRCRELKENNVLNRFWIEAGGGLIEREDRLGRRLWYLSRLVEKYKKDGDITVLERLGFFK